MLLFTACARSEPGGSNEAVTIDSDGQIDYSSMSGDIRIDGSSTVFPISEAVAEEFGKVSNTRVNVAFSGTGGGFERFCRDEIEIADASRQINVTEGQACANNGISDIIEIRVATDALTVVTHPSNDFLDCLTIQQLHNVFKAGGPRSWDQIDPAWPARPIEWYYPGTDSGTFDYFIEEVFTKIDPGATHRGDGTASEDDNVLAQGVENNENAIGYFGFAYFQAAGSGLKAVSIDQGLGQGCVEPSFQNALDSLYKPLSRPLFIYTREKFLRERPEILGFVDFYLKNATALAEEAGYITLPKDILQLQEAKIEPYMPANTN
jgi:phosphate transport system substrate-binding protein